MAVATSSLGRLDGNGLIRADDLLKALRPSGAAFVNPSETAHAHVRGGQNQTRG